MIEYMNEAELNFMLSKFNEFLKKNGIEILSINGIIKKCEKYNTQKIKDIFLKYLKNKKFLNNSCNLKTMYVTKFMEFISHNEDPNIILLRYKEVVQWLFGDTSFITSLLPKKNKTTDVKNYKIQEDIWGKSIMKIRRPDLKLDKQWTNKFGEYICEEIYILLGKSVSKPVKKEHYQPDLEVDDAIIESKAQTFYTDGTARRKDSWLSF